LLWHQTVVDVFLSGIKSANEEKTKSKEWLHDWIQEKAFSQKHFFTNTLHEGRDNQLMQVHLEYGQ